MKLTLEQETANLTQFAIAAVAAEKQSAETLGTPYPATAICAQWCAESGYGAKMSGDENPFGLTAAAAPTFPSKMVLTHEDLSPAQFAQLPAAERATVTAQEDLGGGRYRYHLSRAFASFPSATEGILAYIALITNPTHRYCPAWQQYTQDGDVDALLRGIAAAGYASGGGYGEELVAIADGSRVKNAVAAARGAIS